MNPSLLLLTAALFIWGAGEGMFSMFQPFYLTQLGANPETIGYILGAFGFMMTIAHVPAGYMSDRFGRKPMLIAAWITGLIATWVMALAPNLPFFIVGMLLYGFTNFVSSPLNSYLTAARGAWSIGRAITVSNSLYALGLVIGPFTGGWIGQHFGLRYIYFIAGFLFIISTVMIFMIAAQPLEKHDPDRPAPSLLVNQRYLAYLALGFFAMLSMYISQPFTAKFLQDVRGLSLEQIGGLGTVGGIGNAGLTFLSGFFDIRLGFIFGQVGAALSTGLIWQTNGLGWYGLSYFMFGGYRVARSMYMAQIRPLVLKSQMGLAYGFSETVQSSTMIIAPILAGWLYQWNPVYMYPVSLSATLLSILLSLFFAPQTVKKALQPKIEFVEGP